MEAKNFSTEMGEEGHPPSPFTSCVSYILKTFMLCDHHPDHGNMRVHIQSAVKQVCSWSKLKQLLFCFKYGGFYDTLLIGHEKFNTYLSRLFYFYFLLKQT